MIFGFYEWLIIIMFLVWLGILALTIVSKITHDLQDIWHNREKIRLQTDLEEVIAVVNSEGLYARIQEYVEAFKRKNKRRRYRNLTEEILFEIIEQNSGRADAARMIAYEIGFPKQCINNLQHYSTSRNLRGCLQAKAYTYKPAIPYLISLLQNPLMNLQYDILLALSRFNDPDVIAEAFRIIQKHVLVNERTVRDVVKWLTPENRTILFGYILDMNSEYLSALFLKCIDTESVVVLRDKIVPLLKEGNMKELRIAAVRAISVCVNCNFVPELIEALQDSDWIMRALAAKGLEKIPDDRAIQPLLQAVGDSEWWVRQNAALALLAYPKPELRIIETLKLGDQYAYESLYYAAELKNMSSLVTELEETIRDDEKHLTASKGE